MLSEKSILKQKALHLRKRGLSIRHIENVLKISRSTLSGWFKEIKLNQNQKEILLRKQRNSLVKARRKASEWHRHKKEERIQEAKKEAILVVDNVNFNDSSVLELAMAMLYFGEGSKKTSGLRMSNSNPILLKMFIALLIQVYKIDVNKIKCGLNLRSDQNPFTTKRFWSRELNMPLESFTYVNLDRRSASSKTYPNYKGVCMIRYGSAAIKRRLEFVADEFSRRIIS